MSQMQNTIGKCCKIWTRTCSAIAFPCSRWVCISILFQLSSTCTRSILRGCPQIAGVFLIHHKIALSLLPAIRHLSRLDAVELQWDYEALKNRLGRGPTSSSYSCIIGLRSYVSFVQALHRLQNAVTTQPPLLTCARASL